MNRERAKELLPIIEAFANGEDIQGRRSGAAWIDTNDDPQFQTSFFEWRIKPSPRQFWVNIYPSGVGFDCFATEQEANLKPGTDRSECIKLTEVIE